MKGDKTIVGIIVILTMVLLGGTVGMAASYYLTTSAIGPEENPFKTLEQELEEKNGELAKAVAEERQDIPEQSQAPTQEEIHIESMEELEQALEIWHEIMMQTASGRLSYEDAAKTIYSVSAEIYKRNLPEAFSINWLRSMMKHSKDADNLLKEVKFSEIRNENDEVVLVGVTEVYTQTTAAYQLKLKKENGQWRFMSQVFQ